MKTFTRTIQTLTAAAALLAMPHSAFAVLRTVQSVTPSPTSANVPAGTATNLTITVTVVSGSGSSTRYLGICTNFAFITPAEPTITTAFNPTFFNFPNANSTSNTTLTVSTTASTPAGTYIVSIVAGTNGVPNANVGDVTNTFTLNVGATFVPQKVWTPAGVNTNWSTAGNWTQTGAPTPSNDVMFVDLGIAGSAGLVDNVVDSSLTIGSLTYGQTNNYHTTLIASGQTLTVGGTANGLFVGTGSDLGGGEVTVTTITGAGGVLAATNQNSNINVGQGNATGANAVATAKATLDISGLDKFTATISRLLVGVDVSIKGTCGVLDLAKTNTITATVGSAAPQIDIGDNSQSGGSPTTSSILSLGQTNGIFADSITVGRGKTDNNGGLMVFNSAFSSPTAYFRGTNGAASRVGTWAIGDGFSSRTYYTYGTCDFSLGTVNALVDTMYIGKGATGSTPQNPGTGTLIFNAGTIDVNTLEVGYSFNATGTGTGTVNANGGLLQVNTLLELAHGASSSGTLNISNGTVTANSGITVGVGAASIYVFGGTLNVTNSNATIGTIANYLNTFSVSNATLNLSIQSLVPSVAADGLAANGTANMINVKAVPLLTGFPTQFPLIQYGLNGSGSSGNLGTFAVGTLPSGSPAYGAYISNNVANNSIDIVFTNGPSTPSLTWDGTPSGNWTTNTSTTNWRPKSGPDTYFANGDFATFDDTLAGTPNVNLTTVLSPATLTVNNTNVTFNFSGAGNLTGGMTLVKNGPGTLNLAETGGDNFGGGVLVNNGTVILDNANGNISGGTTINGGTVQVGNNDANGALPAGAVTVSGALVFSNAANLTVSNVISGAGTITQSDTNVTTLSGNNSFNGTATVAAGTLQVGSTNGLGLATSVTVNTGATFDVGGNALFGNGNSALVVTVSGAGVGGNGAIVNNGASQARVLHTVTMTADTTFGGSGDWDIRNSTGSSATADAALNGAYNLTKASTNAFTMRGVMIDAGLGNINVRAGSITITATPTAPLNSLGNSSATVTVYSNATFTLDSIGTIPAKNFVLTNGGTLKGSGTNTFGDPLTLTGAANNAITVVGGGNQFTITSGMIGGGGFIKNGSGVLFLGGNNTYSSNTVVSGGTLALYGGGSDGSISSSANINITGGATVDASGRSNGTFTLASGQTLNGGAGTNGPGMINGIFVASSGSFVAPGAGFGSTNTGAITVSSNAMLQGAAQMTLNAANGASSQLNANEVIYGGALTVSNANGTIANGQTFQLFVSSNGVYNAGTFSSVTLPSAAGLTWTTNLAVNGTITANVVTGPPQHPVITNIGLLGANLHLNGTNGPASQPLYVWASTNLAVPLTNWLVIATNSFTGSGTFNVTVTNAVNQNIPQRFFNVSY